jgi:AbrB family looped-hinge helix DNA binding protein
MERLFTTVSTKGQMVIPAQIREALGIEPGTRVAIRLDGTRLILEPDTLTAKLRRIKEMRGCTAGLLSGTDMLLEDRRLERKRELEKEGW